MRGRRRREAPPGAHPGARRTESGHITIMIIGFAVVLVLTVAVVVNAAHVFQQRRSLVSWSDGAVTAAAQSVAHSRLYDGTPLTRLPVSQGTAREAVAGYVDRHGLAGRFDEFTVTLVTVEPETGRVTVELRASVPLMAAGDLTAGLGSFPITARSSAVVPFE